MKRLFFLFVALSIMPFITSCSIQYGSAAANKYIEGYWGQWYEIPYWMCNGSIGDFIVYHPDQHPSDYCFKIHTTNPPTFSSDDIKHGKWYTCSGYIEYHYYTKYPTNYAHASKDFVNLYLPSLSSVGAEVLRRPATIKIYKDKDVTTYNVYFDDVGFGFSRSNGKLKMTRGAKNALWGVFGSIGVILMSALLYGLSS